MIIGNITRDPDFRYTPQGTAVANFSIATNRTWGGQDGAEKNEDVEYHRIVAWGKLAEICSQLLKKGRKVYVEGYLKTRQWQTEDGQKRQLTEIVMDNMLLLDSKTDGGESEDVQEEPSEDRPTAKKSKTKAVTTEDISDDIPF